MAPRGTSKVSQGRRATLLTIGVLCLYSTIHTKTITNENLWICFCFRFRNGKASQISKIFCCICFRNDHVGHTQATTAGRTYENISSPRDLLSLSYSKREKIGRLIFIHLRCWEVLPFLTLLRQRCIKILCLKDPEF